MHTHIYTHTWNINDIPLVISLTFCCAVKFCSDCRICSCKTSCWALIASIWLARFVLTGATLGTFPPPQPLWILFQFGCICIICGGPCWWLCCFKTEKQTPELSPIDSSINTFALLTRLFSWHTPLIILVKFAAKQERESWIRLLFCFRNCFELWSVSGDKLCQLINYVSQARICPKKRKLKMSNIV